MIVILEIRFGAVYYSRVLTEIVVRRHIARKIECSDGRKDGRVLELKIKSAITGLRVTNQQVLLGPGGGEMTIDPLREDIRYESLVVNRWIVRIVCVP